MEKHHTTDTESVTPQEFKAAEDASSALFHDTADGSSTAASSADGETIGNADISEGETVLTDETDVRTELAQAQEEARIYQDRWTRLAAEFDNYKKRTGREFGMLVKNANESLIALLLPTLDNIERALQAPQTTDETRSFAQGIEIIRQQLKDTLQKEGLQEIAVIGQAFDPTRHEAILVVENKDHPEETIVEQVEKGYMLNDKVLRPAKVIVTRVPAQIASGDAASSNT